MSSEVQVKLLTLLNVSAVKKPFEKDVPGGHRGSPVPSTSRNGTVGLTSTNGSSQSASASGKRKANGSPANMKKRRRSVMFGGVIGPSGSQQSITSKPPVNGHSAAKGKAKANGEGPDRPTSVEKSFENGSSLEGLVLAKDEDDDGGPAAASGTFNY